MLLKALLENRVLRVHHVMHCNWQIAAYCVNIIVNLCTVMANDNAGKTVYARMTGLV